MHAGRPGGGWAGCDSALVRKGWAENVPLGKRTIGDERGWRVAARSSFDDLPS